MWGDRGNVGEEQGGLGAGEECSEYWAGFAAGDVFSRGVSEAQGIGGNDACEAGVTLAAGREAVLQGAVCDVRFTGPRAKE